MNQTRSKINYNRVAAAVFFAAALVPCFVAMQLKSFTPLEKLPLYLISVLLSYAGMRISDR